MSNGNVFLFYKKTKTVKPLKLNANYCTLE